VTYSGRRDNKLVKNLNGHGLPPPRYHLLSRCHAAVQGCEMPERMPAPNRAKMLCKSILSGIAMTDQPTPDQGRVIRFRPRGTPRWRLSPPRRGNAPVRDLSKYESTKGEDDYRHRMTMNALALVVTTVLVVVGTWLAISIADMRKKQDCYLQGGRNCNQLAIPQTER
jgi:hypothetical protein